MARLQDRRAVRLMERMPALLVRDGDINPALMVRLPLLVGRADQVILDHRE